MINPIQVQKFLGGIDYPVAKQDIVNTARNQGATDDVVSTLERLPAEEFASPADVSQAIGELNR